MCAILVILLTLKFHMSVKTVLMFSSCFFPFVYTFIFAEFWHSLRRSNYTQHFLFVFFNYIRFLFSTYMCVCSGNIARCRQAGITHTSNKLTQFFNHCYEFIFNAPRMWKLAKLYCQIHGGALLSIDTLTEEEYIYQILAQSRAMENDIWVGLSDLEQEGIYRWSNGKHAFLQN